MEQQLQRTRRNPSQSFDHYVAGTWFVCTPDAGVSATAVLNWHRQIPIQRRGEIADLPDLSDLSELVDVLA